MPPSGPLPVRYQCATGGLPVTAIVTLATAKSCRFRPDGHQVDRLPPSATVSPGAKEAAALRVMLPGLLFAFMAGVFLLSGLVKLQALGRGAAAQHVKLLRGRAHAAVALLALAAAADLAVAVSLATRPRLGTYGAAALTAIYTGYVALLPEGESCLCFGSRFEARSKSLRIVRNLVLLALLLLAVRLQAVDQPPVPEAFLFAAAILVFLFGLDVLVSQRPGATVRSAPR
jgi:hypothetical protein